MDKVYTKSIRNVVLLGHSGGGKTSLAESMLYISRVTDRLGNVADGNTVCDYDPEEIKRGYSVGAAMAPMLWNGTKINILDTPGFFDFEGEARQCVRVADAAIIVVDGKAGIEVGTEIGWNLATSAGIPKAFFINRFDDGEARFHKVFGAIREKYGLHVCPIQIPIIDGDTVIGFANLVEMCVYTFQRTTGEYVRSSIPEQFKDVCDEYHNMLLEAIAQTSEELMEKFFNEEPISREEALEAIHQGIITGDIVPVFCGAALKNWGIKTFLDTIAESFPRPLARKVEHLVDDEGNMSDVEIDMNSADTSLFVFKTVADPFVGKMSFFKVMNGTLKKDMTLKNLTNGTAEKMSHIYTVKGKNQVEVDELCCGDIGMIAKLANTNTNDTLTDGSEVAYAKITYPTPYMSQAMVPATAKDESKISQSMARMLEEDLTLKYVTDPETHQMVLSGIGDMHLAVLSAKLKARYGVTINLETPKIPYREKITKTVDIHARHKKQNGGSGQFGDVWIKFAPGEDPGLTFTVSVVGGVVPKNFNPAVEKGLLEAMVKGVAGFPMTYLAADLHDGSYHPVDSDEMSFKTAAIMAYKQCLEQAAPVLMEPIGDLDITVPEDLVGDVMGDLNKRRGSIMGMDPAEKKGYTVVHATAPKSELVDYPIALRAMSQGRGSFEFNVTDYAVVPGNISAKIVEDYKKSLA